MIPGRGLAYVTIAAPALVVVPLAGIDAGFQAAVKLAALLGAAVSFAIAARKCRDLTRDEALLGMFAVLAIVSTAFTSRLADGAAAIGCAIGLFSITRYTDDAAARRSIADASSSSRAPSRSASCSAPCHGRA